MKIIDIHKISERKYAGRYDIPLKNISSDIKGHHASTDAIGGCYGIQWYECFKDQKTNEIYKVSCIDGVYGGKDAYSDEDLKFRKEIYLNILNRLSCFDQSASISFEISLNERIILHLFTHAKLFETLENLLDGKQNLEEPKIGLFGYYHGIPIVCVENC